jgi:hypothetical protein
MYGLVCLRFQHPFFVKKKVLAEGSTELRLHESSNVNLDCCSDVTISYVVYRASFVIQGYILLIFSFCEFTVGSDSIYTS